MKEFLMELLQILLTIFIPVITSVLTVFVKKWVDKYIEKVSNDGIKELILEGTDIILDAVDYTQQTYVESLKSTQSFDITAQKEALNIAKDRAFTLMSRDIINAIENRYGEINTYIETVIESAIAQSKNKG